MGCGASAEGAAKERYQPTDNSDEQASKDQEQTVQASKEPTGKVKNEGDQKEGEEIESNEEGAAFLKQEEALRAIQDNFENYVKVKDRLHVFEKFPNCFIGSEAVTALVEAGVAKDKETALKMGNTLLESNYIHHVTNERAFEDGNYFYRFSGDLTCLIPTGPGFWNIRGIFVLETMGMKFDISNHMSLVQKASGKFLIIDGADLSSGSQRELDELTRGGSLVEEVLLTHPFHSLAIPYLFKKFPKAKFYGCPRHLRLEQFKHIPWAGNLMDKATRQLFEPDLILDIPAGADFEDPKPPASNHFSCVFAFHPASKTLHVDDTITMVPNPPSVFRGLGFNPGQLYWHLSAQEALFDPTAFQQWVDNVLMKWDFDVLCMAHSTNLLGGAKAKVGELVETSRKRFVELAAEKQKLEVKKKDAGPPKLTRQMSAIEVSAVENCNKEGVECG